MRYTLERTRQAVQTINFVCCLLFILLGYIYLYFFQGDLMSMTQHILSHGRTTYHIRTYTFIIVSILTTLGLFLNRYLNLPIRAKSLAWFPSCWILGLITRVSLKIPGIQTSPSSVWWYVFGAIVFLICLIFARLYNQNRNENSSFSTLLGPNLALLSLCFSFVFATGNTNRQIHEELCLEQYAFEEEYDKIIRLTSNHGHLTRPMMYLRVYALSKQDKLGDELFSHPNLLNSDAILPQLRDSLRPYNLPRLLRQHLGGMPIHDMSTTNFLRYITADTLCSESSRQYLLSALLLDRNLDEYRDSLISIYVPNDTLTLLSQKQSHNNRWQKKELDLPRTVNIANLPKHYAEALVLCNNLLSNRALQNSNYNIKQNVLFVPTDTTYKKQLELFLSKYSSSDKNNPNEEFVNEFKNTYWYYYFK